MLEVQSQAEYSDDIQAYAAGFLEGCLSWQLIYHHWMNTVREACEGREEFCQRVREFLRNNTEAVRATAVEHQNEDPFWHQVNSSHTVFRREKSLFSIVELKSCLTCKNFDNTTQLILFWILVGCHLTFSHSKALKLSFLQTLH